jgi:ParB family chromosome partitioning protein
VHYPKTRDRAQDEAACARSKAAHEKQRREETIANTTGLRVLSAIGSAVPVRLLKRDLLFVIEKLVGTLDDNRIEMLARQHGIRQKRDDGGVRKTFAAFVRRAEEGTLARLLVESTILLAASRGNPSAVLKDAANAYKVDTDAIATKVKQEFAAKEKAKKSAQPAAKTAKTAA